MRHSTRRQYEGASGRINPVLPDENAHRSFNHIENVVFCMRVRPRPLRMRLQPPLGVNFAYPNRLPNTLSILGIDIAESKFSVCFINTEGN